MADYLIYWRQDTVEANEGIDVLEHTASNQYGKLSEGDVLWVVTSEGRNRLKLVGRQRVDKIVDQDEVEEYFGTEHVWQADYHVLCNEPEEKANLDISEIASRLRIDGTSDRLPAGFTGQHLQAMRQLAIESVQLMEEIWAIE